MHDRRDDHGPFGFNNFINDAIRKSVGVTSADIFKPMSTAVQ